MKKMIEDKTIQSRLVRKTMLSVELPKKIEKRLREIVQENYQGDLQIAIIAFLQLHEKYGWKEQFLQDIEAIREEVRRRGGIKAKTIDAAIKRYRKTLRE